MSGNPKVAPGPGVIPQPGGHPAYASGGPPAASQMNPNQSAQASQQAQLDLESKRMQDLIESITLVSTIRDDINTILDNVGKTNPSLHESLANLQQQRQQQVDAIESGGNGGGETTTAAASDFPNLSFSNFEVKDIEFLEKTDNKFLMDVVVDINRCIKLECFLFCFVYLTS